MADRDPTPRPMTVEDLWSFERLAGAELSPDGRRVAFLVSAPSMEENDTRTDIWLADSDGSRPPRRLTWSGRVEGSAAWSPDGSHLAFAAKPGEDDPAQIYRLPIDGGEAEPLTELPIAAERPRWLPDGAGIIFAAATFPGLDDDFEAVKERLEERKKDEVEAKVTDKRLLRFWDRYRTDGTVPHLFHLDLGSRQIRDLMPGREGLMGFSSFDWDLSPEGTEIAFAANGTEPPWTELRFDLFLLSLESGEERCLTGDHPAWDEEPLYSPDGRFLLFSRDLRPEIGPAFLRLARYDRASGEVELLTADWDLEPGGWRFTPDGRTVLFHAQERGRRHLWALPVEGGTPRKLAAGGTVSSLAAAGERIVYLRASFTAPDELHALDAAGGEPRRLTSFNRERLAELDFGEVEELTFEGAGGERVQTWLFRPPGFDPERRWPLLLLLHGGPYSAWLEDFHYRWHAPLLAAPGYVVAAVNFHGSTGFGQAFAESILGEHGEKPYADVMAATELLLEREWIDAGRTAVAGGSYGGYLATWITAHSDRYAAAVVHSGVFDLRAQFASDGTWTRAANYGAALWEDPERVDRYSPSRFAPGLSTPTLILHGEKDYRVPVTQSINLYNVLQGKGVPSRIVVFPHENHWVLKPRAARLWWREVFAWLERWIGKGPSP